MRVLILGFLALLFSSIVFAQSQDWVSINKFPLFIDSSFDNINNNHNSIVYSDISVVIIGTYDDENEESDNYEYEIDEDLGSYEYVPNFCRVTCAGLRD